MKRTRFTEQKIAFILRQAEEGNSVSEVCRKSGIVKRSGPQKLDSLLRMNI